MWPFRGGRDGRLSAWRIHQGETVVRLRAEHIIIHPEDPQTRLLEKAIERLRAGAVIAYPTDSSYALGCFLGDKSAMERIRRLRGHDKNHHFTLLCRDLSEIANYARINNSDYRLLKSLTPGPYTFILNATKEVPRRVQHAQRKTIGIRVPQNRIAKALLDAMREPLMTCTLMLPGEPYPLSDPGDIMDLIGHEVDVIIDGGNCGLEPTSVIDLTGPAPRVTRVGKGDVSMLDAA